MGRLVRKFGNDIIVAKSFIHAPGYQIDVNTYSSGGVPPDGWGYFDEDVEATDFAPVWIQPINSQDSYTLGAIVDHQGTQWRSLIANNVWQPGVSGWVNVSTSIPEWIQPTGAHDAYAKDVIVTYQTHLWISLVDANVWQPGVSSWRKTALVAPDGVPVIPPWVQPTGAHDAYELGAQVTHNGQTWTSTIAANVWEPGVFGWVVS